MIDLAFFALALAICCLPLRAFGSMHLPLPSLVFALCALLFALHTAIINVQAALLGLFTALLALWLAAAATPPLWLRAIGWCMLALLTLSAALHMWPGIHNPLLVNAQQLTPDAIPFTLYANFDKGLAGYCLLLALWPTQATQTSQQSLLQAYWRGFWPAWPLSVALAMACAIGLGLITFAPKWPDFALQFIFCNLLLTCVAEEAFFRGLLQRPLFQQFTQRGWSEQCAAWCAIVMVSLLFGLAHLAGGWAYALVATVASVGYGWAYQRSGRIEVAIVAHFGLNLLHFGLLTYPMLR